MLVGERALHAHLGEILELRRRCEQSDDLTTDPEYFVAANAMGTRRCSAVVIRGNSNKLEACVLFYEHTRNGVGLGLFRGGDYIGESLGLPQSGPGSLAPMGRRLGALTIDWLIAYGLAALALRFGLFPHPALSTAVLAIWLVLGVVAVRLFTFTPGQLALRLHVVTVDGRGVGIGRAVVRGLLIGTVVPALFTDWDGRGLQDRLTATAVVRR